MKIKKITRKEYDKMLDSRKPFSMDNPEYKPRGRFYLYLEKEDLFIAVDNLDGNMWVEEFDNYKDCMGYLKGNPFKTKQNKTKKDQNDNYLLLEDLYNITRIVYEILIPCGQLGDIWSCYSIAEIGEICISLSKEYHKKYPKPRDDYYELISNFTKDNIEEKLKK